MNTHLLIKISFFKSLYIYIYKYYIKSNFWKIHHLLQTDKLKTGCKEIDEVLGGGLLCPGVTEVAGESSSGKTQFCLQACIVTSILNPGHSMNIIRHYEL